jgi:hypothetical protein
LHSLDFFARSPSVAFIRALTLPGLRVLALTQAEWTAPVLVALHARSHFRLESLTLTNLLIELDDFTLFLRLLSTLQEVCNAARGENRILRESRMSLLLCFNSSTLLTLIFFCDATRKLDTYPTSILIEQFGRDRSPRPCRRGPYLQLPFRHLSKCRRSF